MISLHIHNKSSKKMNLATAISFASEENNPDTTLGTPKNGPPIFMTAFICLAHQFGPPPPPMGAGASTHFIKCKKYRTPIECGITTTFFPPLVATMSSILLFILLKVWSRTCPYHYNQDARIMQEQHFYTYPVTIVLISCLYRYLLT